jgi:hypothetical protein
MADIAWTGNSVENDPTRTHAPIRLFCAVISSEHLKSERAHEAA